MSLKSLRELNRVSQADVAELANMTPVGVHRYEQLLYAKPSANYLAALSKLLPGNPTTTDLAHDYKQAREERIEKTVALLSNVNQRHIIGVLDACSSMAAHPYAMFRKRMLAAVGEPISDINWCVLTCFHPAQLDRFEKVGLRIPVAQREILERAGMKDAVVELNKYIEEWHRHD